ncbi:MAG: hypothetical protein GXP06_06040 [Alphaproteobacteria bacterium]|nr:hypothetical protein [Alphaproteobacteria bacterium]
MVDLRLVGVLKKLSGPESQKSERSETAFERGADALIFLGFLIISALAIAAVAIAAPVVLAISAIAGLMSSKADRTGWRPAGA